MFICMVYEQYFRYKQYDKFHEVSLAVTVVDIKEKYIENDTYKLEFFEVPPEYGEKVLKYLQDKHLKTSYPVKLYSGVLQKACHEFISKCNQIVEEKRHQVTPWLDVSAPISTQRVIALIKHKLTEEVTVVCNRETISPSDFLQNLTSYTCVSLCEHALMLAEQINTLLTWFHQEFTTYRSQNTDMGLSWYKVSDICVLQWLSEKNNHLTPPTTPLPALTLEPLFSDNNNMFDSMITDDHLPSKKKRREI